MNRFMSDDLKVEATSMELPTTLKNLANILKLRKQLSRPYNLLLTSTISLTPEVLKKICNSNNWDDFRAYLHGLGKNLQIDVLTYHLGAQNNLDGYLSLAHLMKEGYFSTILTTNLDSTLQDALLEYGLRPNAYQMLNSFQTLVVERDKDDYITTALGSQPGGIRIIKLRGSLSDRVIPDTFPEFFQFGSSIRDGLERYLNQDIIIVGSIERENDIRRSLSHRGDSIYYVLPQEPTYDDDVIKAMRARGNDPSKFVICGPYGHFRTFFKTLESTIMSNASTASDLISPPAQSDTIPATRKRAKKPSEAVPTKTPSEPVKVSETTHPPARQEPALTLLKNEKGQSTLQSSLVQRQEELVNSNMYEKVREKQPLWIIRIISGVLAIAALLGMVSLFTNLTPSFNPIFIIPLLIILFAFVLGIMGILTASQVTQIFSQGLTVKGDGSKNENKKAVTNSKTQSNSDTSEKNDA